MSFQGIDNGVIRMALFAWSCIVYFCPLLQSTSSGNWTLMAKT